MLLIPSLYMGAYYALLEPTSVFSLAYDGTGFKQMPDYSIGGEGVQTFFNPIHCLDRLVRPSHWQIDPSRIGVDFDFNIDEPDSPSDDPTVDCLP